MGSSLIHHSTKSPLGLESTCCSHWWDPPTPVPSESDFSIRSALTVRSDSRLHLRLPPPRRRPSPPSLTSSHLWAAAFCAWNSSSTIEAAQSHLQTTSSFIKGERFIPLISQKYRFFFFLILRLGFILVTVLKFQFF